MSEQNFKSDDGVRLVYDDVGPRDGVPVVLCHGVTMEGPQFRDTADVLVQRGCRVLMPDLRGHGRSGVPAEVSRRTFALARFGADAQAMLDHAGLTRVHWVGNSLGGIVGLSLLPAGRFLSLTTYGTAYQIGTSGDLAQAWLRLSFHTLGHERAARIAAFLVSPDKRTEDYVVSRVLATPPEVVAAIVGVVGHYDFRPLVRAATMPVQLLDCGRDWLVGFAMGSTMRLARKLSGVTVVALPKGGHCADLDAPEAFRAAVVANLGLER